MTVINPNSISGITSITLPSGDGNVLTIHTNDGTERFRIDSSGNVKVGSAATISPDGDLFVTGVTTTGGHFAGSGANLTSLPAANLTGTIADARFPATLPAASAANLTSIPAANVTGTLPALTAANLTNIPAANLVGVCTSGLTKTGGFGSTGWTHGSNTSFGSGGSYTFSGIPTDTTALRIGFTDLSSNTGSNGSESYAGFRLGNASGLLDTNYDTVSSYLEDSYQQVETWTSRAILFPSNYGRAEHVFNGQIECWKLGDTTRWFIKSQLTRGAASGNQTHFFMQSSIDLGADITQAQIFLNTGSFDGGSGAISYYQD